MMGMTMRIGILTGGGDCPGLNAVLRSVVAVLHDEHGHSVVGFQNAWHGVLTNEAVTLDVPAVRDIIHRGGTIIGTRRGSPFDVDGGAGIVAERIEELGLDGLVVVGGNGSLTVAQLLRVGIDLPVVGVPKTIDNDIFGTDVCFGFNTAVQIATDAIDRLHTTSESHDRVIVVEVMGRDAGWIAAHAALAGGACALMIPEFPMTPDEVAASVIEHHGNGRSSSIVVAAEGAVKQQGSLETIAAALEAATGFDVRSVSLGYVQRGGTPTAYDRALAAQYGVAAADSVLNGAWGRMVSMRDGRMGTVDLAEVAGRTRLVDAATYEVVTRALL